MKRRLRLIICCLFLFLGINTYNAACNNEEIKSQVQDVGAYGIGSLAVDLDDEDYAGIYVENIPENVYIIAVNNTTNTKETYKEFEDGTLLIKSPDQNHIYEYTIKVYSSSSECENELIRSINVKSPMYNALSASSECAELAANDELFEGCEYFTERIYTDEIFKSELEKFKNRQPEEVNNKIIELFYKYYYYALIPIAVLGVYYIIRLSIIKRRKKKDEEQ